MDFSNSPIRNISDVSYDFGGRTVIITGAGRGLGRSHAEAFAAAGANVVLCARGRRGSARATDEISEALAAVSQTCRDGPGAGGVLALTCDVSDERQVAQTVRAAVAEFGAVDVLVNNAGIMEAVPAVEMTEAVWDRVIDVNLKGTWLFAKHVAPHMIEAGRGRIINTGSGASLVGVPMLAHYTAAKHGIAGLTKALAIELAPHGVTVNYVCPTLVATPMMAEGFSSVRVADDAAGALGALAGTWNLLDSGMPIAPEEVTNAVLWLSSDASHYMTGASLVIDAGFSCK
jgi:NAD(P)-dependent dehydrogenase (short-subunit alcohol dehydrogenase family)